MGTLYNIFYGSFIYIYIYIYIYTCVDTCVFGWGGVTICSGSEGFTSFRVERSGGQQPWSFSMVITLSSF